MWILKIILNLRQAIRTTDTPRQLALGFALGLWLGLAPKDNLFAASIGLLVLATRVNLAIATVTAILVSMFGGFADPAALKLGRALLLYRPLEPMWRQLEAWELFRVWSQFNRPAILGGFSLGAVTFLPAYMISRPFFARYWPRRSTEASGGRLAPESSSEEIMASEHLAESDAVEDVQEHGHAERREASHEREELAAEDREQCEDDESVSREESSEAAEESEEMKSSSIEDDEFANSDDSVEAKSDDAVANEATESDAVEIFDGEPIAESNMEAIEREPVEETLTTEEDVAEACLETTSVAPDTSTTDEIEWSEAAATLLRAVEVSEHEDGELTAEVAPNELEDLAMESSAEPPSSEEEQWTEEMEASLFGEASGRRRRKKQPPYQPVIVPAFRDLVRRGKSA